MQLEKRKIPLICFGGVSGMQPPKVLGAAGLVAHRRQLCARSPSSAFISSWPSRVMRSTRARGLGRGQDVKCSTASLMPCARPAALVAMVLPVAVAPLAHSILGSALTSMKQAVPAAWQGCPRVLPAPASRSRYCCPRAAHCLQRGAFATLMRLGRLGPRRPSALIKVLAALPARVGGSGPIGCPRGDVAPRCAPGGEEEEAAAVLAALPGRAWLGGLVGCRDLGTVATGSASSHWWGVACAHCAGTCSPCGIVRQHGRTGAPKNHS